METGIELISEDRARQINEEGWLPEHDAEHSEGELAMAACCYAAPTRIYIKKDVANGYLLTDPWPWTEEWDKRQREHGGNVLANPDNQVKELRVRNLVKAGALIAAEIDRIQATENY